MHTLKKQILISLPQTEKQNIYFNKNYDYINCLGTHTNHMHTHTQPSHPLTLYILTKQAKKQTKKSVWFYSWKLYPLLITCLLFNKYLLDS